MYGCFQQRNRIIILFSIVSIMISLKLSALSLLRCLDEWDVFLDAINRKEISKELLKFGLENPNKQFIFISPQVNNHFKFKISLLFFLQELFKLFSVQVKVDDLLWRSQHNIKIQKKSVTNFTYFLPCLKIFIFLTGKKNVPYPTANPMIYVYSGVVFVLIKTIFSI